jgi:hypothetical protein
MSKPLSVPISDILGQVVLSFKLKIILRKNSIASFKQICYSLTDTEVFSSTVTINTKEDPLKSTAHSTKRALIVPNQVRPTSQIISHWLFYGVVTGQSVWDLS